MGWWGLRLYVEGEGVGGVEYFVGVGGVYERERSHFGWVGCMSDRERCLIEV